MAFNRSSISLQSLKIISCFIVLCPLIRRLLHLFINGSSNVLKNNMENKSVKVKQLQKLKTINHFTLEWNKE